MKNDDLLRVKLLRLLLELEEERAANLNLDNQYEANSYENEVEEIVQQKASSQ
ncbi:hypothetical protein [Paenibacillus lautus]|uniref:hypothetical protein n=1 Tax=Paenibacillus lautus TaxID=1401 RepID=UPI001C7D3C55|nr:hypothetical protein [Paenibacillus lautus]MBX4150745.1 hypothetical protein [Paenibacillus lautus]